MRVVRGESADLQLLLPERRNEIQPEIEPGEAELCGNKWRYTRTLETVSEVYLHFPSTALFQPNASERGALQPSFLWWRPG